MTTETLFDPAALRMVEKRERRNCIREGGIYSSTAIQSYGNSEKTTGQKPVSQFRRSPIVPRLAY
jgi:hypothetical protein